MTEHTLHLFSSLPLISQTLPLSNSSLCSVQAKRTFFSPAKPSQSSNWGWRLAQSASRRPPVRYPFLRLIAKLGSITDTLTLTGEYAYTNDFEVRLRALTDLARI